MRNSEVTTKLQSWIKNAIQTHVWERGDDIHIDEIDPAFSNKTRWVTDAIALGEIFSSLVKDTPYIGLLTIQLTYSDAPTKIEGFGLHEIQNEIYLTPPSFYLFPRKSEALELTLVDLVSLHRLSHESGFPTFFRDEFEEGDGYFRVVYFLLQ